MKRIAILTAGGDTPALNATIYGAVERASTLGIRVFGIIRGFSGVVDPRVPHVHLNPLNTPIPELDPSMGGTLLGTSRTYIDPQQPHIIEDVTKRLTRLGIDGLVCIGGDGTLSGMQPLSEQIPCVLAPKTIDNDLGLNYIDEPNEWTREPSDKPGKFDYKRIPRQHDFDLEDCINYATPGYATAVYVVAQGIQRLRTTAESHRRIAIVEVMGRESGYIALGSAYGQPDIILIPEVPLNVEQVVQRVRELYELQQHVVIVVGEGVVDQNGHQLGAVRSSLDPAGNVLFSGAAEALKQIILERLPEEFFCARRTHEPASSTIFTRKVGHTQRGGRPILFDRFYGAQLGGKAVDMLVEGQSNSVATLQWSQRNGFYLDSLPAGRLCDPYGMIHARFVHPALYDKHRCQPSRLGIEYLLQIFSNAIGADDVEHLRADLFSPGNLATRYQSVVIQVQKRMRYLSVEEC